MCKYNAKTDMVTSLRILPFVVCPFVSLSARTVGLLTRKQKGMERRSITHSLKLTRAMQRYLW